MTKNTISKGQVASLVALLSFTAYMPLSCTPAFADISATTLPDLNSAINGSITQEGNKLKVDNTTYTAGTVAQFDWNTFNVGKDAEVNFGFSANSQTILNRVLASGGMSEIYGKLTNRTITGCASCVNTGKVILINPSGVLFGQGSNVNLNSLTASTFDIKGAKDLKDLSASELATYRGFNETTKTASGGLVDMAGYNKNVSFEGNNNMVSANGDGVIVVNANGTRLASVVADGADLIYGDKNVAFVGNKIEVNNSKVSSHFNSTPNTGTKYDANGNANWNSNKTATEYFQTRSGVKFVTGDGVNFYYQPSGGTTNLYNGARDGSTASSTLPFAYTRTADNMVAGQEYGVTIKDSVVTGGNFDIHNGVESSANSSVNIDNSVIQTHKILGADSYYDRDKDGVYETRYYAEDQGTSGGIWITGSGAVNINDSDIQVNNDTLEVTSDKGGTSHTVTGADIQGGHLVIEGNEDINITNSYLRTMDSTKNTDTEVKAGIVDIVSKNGNINLTKTDNAPTTRVDGEGLYIQVQAAGGLTLDAQNGDINIDGYDKVWAFGDQDISGDAWKSRNLVANANNINLNNTLLNSGDITLNAENINTTNGATVQSVYDLNMHANKTTLDSSTIAYSNISFYDADSTKVNDVTIKNGTTFKNPSGDTVIETNGDILVDNSALQGKYWGESAANQKSVTLISTNGDVTIQNNANIQTTDGSISATAQNGNVNVKDSKLYANNGSGNLTAGNSDVIIDNSTLWTKDGDISVNALNGKVSATNSTLAAEGGNTTIRQANAIDIDTNFNNSTIGATGKLTIQSDSDITGTKLVAGTGYIQDTTDLTSLNNTDKGIKFIFDSAKFDSGNDITATDAQSLKNVDLVAAGNIDLTSTVNMTLTNVSTDANGTTDLAAAGRLQANDYEIINGTKTTLNGNTVVTGDDTSINANGNKLAINADYDINVAVKGVNNANKGIEVNANVNTSNGSDPLQYKNVTINALDGTLSISKIKADTLNLTADTILASATTISASTDNIDKLTENNVSTDAKAYIEVRTDGGFNLDPTTTYSDNNSSIYTGGNYGTSETNKVNVGDTYTTSDTVVISETENSTLISSDTTLGNEISRENLSKNEVSKSVSDPERTLAYDDDGNPGYIETITTTTVYEVTDNVTYETSTTNTYQDTKTTTTETTTNTYQDYEIVSTGNDTQHIATLNNNEQNAFVLVYGKTTQSGDTGTELISTNVTTDTVTTNVGGTDGNNGIRQEIVAGTTIQQETYTVSEDTVTRNFCPDPAVEQETETIDTLESQRLSAVARLPRHAEGTTETVVIQNDLADASSTVVAAAARLELDDSTINAMTDDEYDYDDEYLN